MGWKKMIFGEKMPDKHDPKYKDRYEREVAAGRRFANGHKKLFLSIVFGLVVLSFGFNILQMVRICNRQQTEKQQVTAIQHQEHLIKKNTHQLKPQRHEDYRQD